MPCGDKHVNDLPYRTTEDKRRLLRGSIKLLVTIGFLFLLVPFFRSIPWPETAIPDNATHVRERDMKPGVPLAVTLSDGSRVFVTRLDTATRKRLAAMPAERFWYPSAPGLLDQGYIVVSGNTSLDEAVAALPPSTEWPGGFIAAGGNAWDVAGRALKPYPGHPGDSPVKTSNLIPSPWQRHDDGVLLIPMPETPTSFDEPNENGE